MKFGASTYLGAACVCLWFPQVSCNAMLQSHPLQNQPAEAMAEPVQSPNQLPIADPNNPLSTDSRTFFGMPRCGNANLAVCDSFEAAVGERGPAAALDSNYWEVEVSGGEARVELDDSRAARGQGALHVHVPASGYQHAMVVHKKLFPVQGNTFFGRAFVYLAGAAPQDHFTLFSASGTLAHAAAPTYVRYGGEFGLLEANYVGNGQYQHAGVLMGDGTWSDTTQVPSGRWTCLEWQFKGDTNEMHFWVDGIDVPRLAVIGESDECCKGQVWHAPPYERIALGWEMYGTSRDSTIEAYDLWLDEIALDTQRIGCAR